MHRAPSDDEASPCCNHRGDDSPTRRIKQTIMQATVGTNTALQVGFDTLTEDIQEKHDETNANIGHVSDNVNESERNQVQRHEESKSEREELLKSNQKLSQQIDELKSFTLDALRRNLLPDEPAAVDGTNTASAADAAVPACIVSRAGNPADDVSTAASTQSSLTQPSTQPFTRQSSQPPTPSSKGRANKARVDGGKENNGCKMSHASTTKSSRHEASVKRFLRQKKLRREQDELERSAGLDRD